MRFVDYGLYYILDVAFLELFHLIEGRFGVIAALYEFDVLEIVDLRNDNVLLEVRRLSLQGFHLRLIHPKLTK